MEERKISLARHKAKSATSQEVMNGRLAFRYYRCGGEEALEYNAIGQQVTCIVCCPFSECWSVILGLWGGRVGGGFLGGRGQLLWTGDISIRT